MTCLHHTAVEDSAAALRKWRKYAISFTAMFFIALTMLYAKAVLADDDPHYTEAGFFDIHVCNWPDRPLFYMLIFSTYRYKELKKVEVLDADGQRVSGIDLQRYRIVKTEGKPEKRVFITQCPVPQNATDGWYSAKILMQDGSQYLARDFVIIQRMQRANIVTPPNEANLSAPPKVFRWSPVPGAKHYRVFIKDILNDDKTIVESGVLDKPEFTPPEGLLQHGGWYRWRVHARDVNEHALLGDFNHGSLTRWFSFEVAEPGPAHGE